MSVLDSIEQQIPALRRYARALLGSVRDADDLVQDCLVQAIAHIKPTMDDRQVRPWLFTILRNRFISDLRKSKGHRNNVSIDDAGGNIPSTEPNQEGQLQMRDLKLGLAALPSEQREVLLLVTLEGFDYAEVANMFGIPIGTVMSRLSRGRDRLRMFMDGEARPLLRSVT